MANQSGWRWCHKCQGLSFAGNPDQGACPAGGKHDHAGSGAYAMQFDPTMKLIDNGAFGAKVTMVVVGDGFTASDQDQYNRHVDALLTNGLFIHDFYAANRAAFNL